ncbi:MAG: efflux RND transporter periplasmic adaptor subunit [Verrucomicrobiota bacterium]
MKTLFIYALISTLPLSIGFNLSAADSAGAKKTEPKAVAKKTTDTSKVSSSKTAPNPAGAKEAKNKTASPTTHTLKKGLFEVKVELTGIFDAVKTSPIRLAPKQWNSMSVVKAAAHGEEVKKGDLILQLKTEKLEKAIKQAELARPLADLSLSLAVLDLIEAKKSTPLSLDSRQRSMLHSEEDLAYFEKTDRPQREKSARENLKQNTQYLSYAREELDQLQKMYDADDITEETEQIIVTRAKNSVEGAQFRVESSKLSTARTLATTIPREHESLKRRVQSAAISWDKYSKSLPQALKKKQLEVDKMKRDQKELAEQLGNMKKDLQSFSVKAPHDGIVYYGANVRGKWATATLAEKKLAPGGKLMPHEVFMTVVQSQQLQVQTSIPENKLSLLKKGLKAKITATAAPDAPLQGQLSSMNRVPLTSGGFPGTLEITSETKGLYPGMSCKIQIEIYKNNKALTVPKKAVRKENEKSFVTLKNGKKQEVKTGRTDSKLIEILSGLKEGDTIKL